MYSAATLDQLLEIMKHLQGDKTQLEFAKQIGVSPQYLCDVYHNRREPGEKILNSLGATRSYVVPSSLISTTSTATKSQEESIARKTDITKKVIRPQKYQKGRVK